LTLRSPPLSNADSPINKERSMDMQIRNIDFGRTADDYRRHRAGFPDSLFTRLAVYGVGIAGQRLLDIGTGTGSLARGFAKRGCQVTGLDPSVNLTAQARELDQEASVSIDYVTARIEENALPDASFDVVTAGQCWHCSIGRVLPHNASACCGRAALCSPRISTGCRGPVASSKRRRN
jgi:SAM-dependent methyltransferase